jgi:hypothetical protein
MREWGREGEYKRDRDRFFASACYPCEAIRRQKEKKKRKRKEKEKIGKGKR